MGKLASLFEFTFTADTEFANANQAMQRKIQEVAKEHKDICQFNIARMSMLVACEREWAWVLGLVMTDAIHLTRMLSLNTDFPIRYYTAGSASDEVELRQYLNLASGLFDEIYEDLVTRGAEAESSDALRFRKAHEARIAEFPTEKIAADEWRVKFELYVSGRKAADQPATVTEANPAA